MSKTLLFDNTTFTTTPVDLDVDISGLWGTRFGVALTGDFDGATISFEGGDGTTYEPIKITSLVSGATHTALAVTVTGTFMFDACCTHLRFALTGGTTPDVAIALHVQSRP